MERRIRKFLNERKNDSSLRTLNKVSRLGEGRILVDGREYINFSSNDYLGLAYSPRLVAAAAEVLSNVVGSSASRLMTGSLELHHRLEERTAQFKNKPAALVFNSGYQANVGIISALCGKEDCVFSDRLNHASIVDGIKLSGARFFRFRHNDTEHLEELLKRHRKDFKGALIVTETVFSMDGDIAPLDEIATLKVKYDSMLMVDEAHATGVFGKEGSGISEEQGVSQNIDIIMGTFSKALGGFGAYAAASKEICDYLINACRSFIYSTSLPEAIIAANIAALEVVKEEPFRREKLLLNAARLRRTLKGRGFSVGGESQIIPVVIGDNKTTVIMSEELKQKGYWVTPVRPPTVPLGEARLRISLTYDHSEEVLDKFADDLSKIGSEIFETAGI